ncbi:NAD(P)-binding protein [Westerdykella ornata]|uniref:NAD(P)-binding protein n=1 Tax=Westerdykella ornata TaxID=318751 RepID=A0A6A6JBU4_WESOR|nr:NAD(P)-binding protein [Westerdykella ornata]KAF2273106.1 NAD(P)-binding protein [Westerdykella ornata]
MATQNPNDKKVITIFGATGNQGSSVLKTLLTHSQLSSLYTPRCITRSLASPAAQQLLQKANVEVVEADLSRPETLPAALKDTHTLFLVTTSIYPGRPGEPDTAALCAEKEFQQAKNAVDEAVRQGVQYIIFSSLVSPFELSKGKLAGVTHFDVKVRIEEYIRQKEGETGGKLKSAFFGPGAFMQNFQGGGFAPKWEDGKDGGAYVMRNLCSPGTKVPFIDITETGQWIAPLLLHPERYYGKSLLAASEWNSFGEVAKLIEEKTGKKVRFEQVAKEDMEKWFQKAPEVGRMVVGMYVWVEEGGYFGPGGEEGVAWAKAQVEDCGGRVSGVAEWLDKVGYALD